MANYKGRDILPDLTSAVNLLLGKWVKAPLTLLRLKLMEFYKLREIDVFCSICVIIQFTHIKTV